MPSTLRKEIVSSFQRYHGFKNHLVIFQIKYMICPKVENFEKFQKSLKYCSFINNDDNELKLGVCVLPKFHQNRKWAGKKVSELA